VYSTPASEPYGQKGHTQIYKIKVIQGFVFCSLNVWPDEDLPDFSSAVQKLGDLIIEVGLLVTRLCDLYVKSKLPDFPDGKLEKVLKESTTAKARVLHYFPQMPHADLHAGKWCGQHTDHGSLTGWPLHRRCSNI
jgi:isopenicillin N synthase-like dioxygenase